MPPGVHTERKSPRGHWVSQGPRVGWWVRSKTWSTVTPRKRDWEGGNESKGIDRGWPESCRLWRITTARKHRWQDGRDGNLISYTSRNRDPLKVWGLPTGLGVRDRFRGSILIGEKLIQRVMRMVVMSPDRRDVRCSLRLCRRHRQFWRLWRWRGLPGCVESGGNGLCGHDETGRDSLTWRFMAGKQLRGGIRGYNREVRAPWNGLCDRVMTGRIGFSEHHKTRRHFGDGLWMD